MTASLLRSKRKLTGSWQPAQLIEHWASRALGNSLGRDRYHWELSHGRGTGIPAYAGDPSTWRAWRRAEQSLVDSDVFAFEERLMVPIVAAESAELLAEARELEPRAAELLEQADPVLRREFSACALERNSWSDSFGLFCLTRYPKLLERLHPIAIAIAESFASRARHRHGVVEGTRFPFHEKPLVSATAQLAHALLTLGSHFELVSGAVEFVTQSVAADGGFGDAGGESDVLTTWIAAELLSVTDPNFDPGPTARFFASQQRESGFFRALGPEQPWLTAQIVDFLGAARASFAKRFRFPHVQAVNLDRKTRLPFFAYFVELTQLFAQLPGIRAAELELGFLDLVGFREFNNRYGQALGDEVLAEFAAALAELTELRAVRDGGDEFLLIGAPTYHGVYERIARLQQEWPARFRARFGPNAPPVLSRALVATTRGADLSQSREELGRAIGGLKHAPMDPELGLLQSLSSA